MLKLLLVPLALVLVSLAVFSGAPLLQAQACGPYCESPGGYQTPTATAIGTTCAIAQSNLNSQLQSYALSFCGSQGCQRVVTITVACHATGSGYSISGYATHGCRDSTC